MTEKIKEVIIDLTIDDSGLASHISEKINGFLQSIFIEKTALGPIKILITHEYWDNLKILDTNLQNTVEYFFPEVQVTSEVREEKFTFRTTKYPLNDRLKIDLSGLQNTKIKITIRYM